MNGILRDFRHALCMGVVVPVIALSLAVRLTEWSDREVPEFSAVTDLESPDSTSGITAGTELLLRDGEGIVHTVLLESYLVEAVLGEMPAAFDSEALKAQAVAARTYALKSKETGGKHGDGSICTDPGCCQANCSESTFLHQGGTPEQIVKVKCAVQETEGLVLTYEGALIDATYYACSGGRTEDAVAVWGTDYPYLRATDSPGEESAEYYQDSKWISFQEFQDALSLKLDGAPESWLGAVTYTSGGGVDTVEIGGVLFSGPEIRRMLGLRSTVFSAVILEDGIRFDTKGYGHRVGMSQYGANAMAQTGSSFAEILAHYYPGTTLQKYVEKQAIK